jgi:ribosomal protein S18 acetylase RimI-like enzyme
MTEDLKQGVYPRQTLTDAELAEIEKLANACERYEDIDLRIVWDALRLRTGDATNDFLYYSQNLLVGFLTVEGLGEAEAEATGTVLPEYRRRGIFRQLVAAAQDECRRSGSSSLMFSCDHRSAAARPFFDAIGATYEFAEHKMRLDMAGPVAYPDTRLEITKATADDAPAIAAIIAQDAGITNPSFSQHIADNMRRPVYQYYIARLDGTPAGTLNVQILNGDAYIYGFVVRQEYRGRGYGRQILTHVIADIAASRPQPLFLEVETDNTPALGLYRSAGFEIVRTYDYYRVSSQ